MFESTLWLKNVNSVIPFTTAEQHLLLKVGQKKSAVTWGQIRRGYITAFLNSKSQKVLFSPLYMQNIKEITLRSKILLQIRKKSLVTPQSSRPSLWSRSATALAVWNICVLRQWLRQGVMSVGKCQTLQSVFLYFFSHCSALTFKKNTSIFCCKSPLVWTAAIEMFNTASHRTWNSHSHN